MRTIKFYTGLVLVVIVLSILITGCVQRTVIPLTGYIASVSESKPLIISSESLRVSTARYIGNFAANIRGDAIEARFSLIDNSGRHVAADGIGEVKIVNLEGETIYTGTVDVRKEGYSQLYNLGLNEVFSAYVWRIPLSEIKKSSPSTHSSGTIYLKFKTRNAIFDEISTSIFGLPVYSKDELEQSNEKEFYKYALSVNKKLSEGNFEVTVKRVGFYTPIDTIGNKREYFRIDIEIKNNGDLKENFYISGLALLDNKGNQYDKVSGGTLDVGSFLTIYPGVKKSGYLLFEGLPKTTQSIKLVFDLGHGKNYTPYTFEYNITLPKQTVIWF